MIHNSTTRTQPWLTFQHMFSGIYSANIFIHFYSYVGYYAYCSVTCFFFFFTHQCIIFLSSSQCYLAYSMLFYIVSHFKSFLELGYKSNIHSVFHLWATFTKKEKTKSHTLRLGLYANERVLNRRLGNQLTCCAGALGFQKRSVPSLFPVLADRV